MGIQAPCVYASLENSAQAKFCGTHSAEIWESSTLLALYRVLFFTSRSFFLQFSPPFLCAYSTRYDNKRIQKNKILHKSLFFSTTFSQQPLPGLAFFILFLDVSLRLKLQQNYIIDLSIFNGSNCLSFHIIDKIITYEELIVETKINIS